MDDAVLRDRMATRRRHRPHSSEEAARPPAATVRPRLAGLATAVPGHILRQPEVAARARVLFADMGESALQRLMPVFQNAGIDRRFSCVPIDWYTAPHGWRDRNALYVEHASELLERAARDCLAEAGVRPKEIDAVVAVSSTGIATPSLDAIVMNRLGMRPDVRRLPIFGLGCAGGVLGLARAADVVRVDPGAKVLLLVVELCGLAFRKDDRSKSGFISTALFGDGAAAALICGVGDGPAFGAGGEHTWPDTLEVTGWDVEDDGLRALLSADIPMLARGETRSVTTEFLARHGLDLSAIEHFICHPGGTKVLTAIEEALGLGEGALALSRGVLRDFGNMSGVTVLFVLDRALRDGATGRMLLSTLGPGFTAAFQLLEAS